jgi:hypothetical protein
MYIFVSLDFCDVRDVCDDFDDFDVHCVHDGLDVCDVFGVHDDLGSAMLVTVTSMSAIYVILMSIYQDLVKKKGNVFRCTLPRSFTPKKSLCALSCRTNTVSKFKDLRIFLSKNGTPHLVFCL